MGDDVTTCENAIKIETDFLATVKTAKRLSLLKKEELKKRKIERNLEILEECKLHHGPATIGNIEYIAQLSEKDLLAEIEYLRATIAASIRQMRRINVDGKYRMEKFSADELGQAIKNIIKPESDVYFDLESMIKGVI